MRAEYENVLDDHPGKIHFTYVNTWDELLPAHWHEHLKLFMCWRRDYSIY